MSSGCVRSPSRMSQLGWQADGCRSGRGHPSPVDRDHSRQVLFIAVLGSNLLGDALRDVLEPRLRGVNPTARRLSRG